MQNNVRKRVLMLLENCSYPADVRVASEAQSLVRAGYQVSVICPARPEQLRSESVQGVEVYRYPRPGDGQGFLGYLWEYGYAMTATFLISVWLWCRHGFDIVHAHNPPDTFVLIGLFYKCFGKQYVYDHHDLAPEMYYERFSSKGNHHVYRVLQWFERLSCWAADQVIATNASYKAMEMQRGKVPENRIAIVRNGPDLAYFKPSDTPPESQYAGKIILGYVGVIGFQDGMDCFLRALRHLVYTLGRTDVMCVIVGAGDAWASMKQLAEQLGVADYIQFVGKVERTRVPEYLNQADICIAPEPSNAYNDRCTIVKVAEYMACGKPVVAFDLPEHRTTAQDAALYAKPNYEMDFARQIAILMDDAALRQQMGQLGRQRVEDALAWTYQEQQLLNVYTALVEKDFWDPLRSWTDKEIARVRLARAEGR